VLIVDDAVEIRQLLHMTLELDGRFEVVGEAENGQEGVDLAADLRPDLVVLDVEMPVLDGMAALPELRRVVPHAQVVMYSSAPADLEESALAAGAAGYRVKGSDLDELVALLAKLGSA